jgi:Fe-S cluster biogenesis protein NfuA
VCQYLPAGVCGHGLQNNDERHVETEEHVKEKVEKALDLIRPSLEADGGNVELIGVDEATGTVKVKLVGACGSCPMSQLTLRMGVERVLKEQVPEVKVVEAV